MGGIAVGRAIASGFRFLVEEVFTIVALSWVAALLYAGLRLWLVSLGPAVFFFSTPWGHLIARFAVALASLLLTSAIAVPLTRAALGYSSPFLLARFQVGARELKLFWAQIRIYLLLIALAAAGGLVVAGSAKAMAALVPQEPLAALAVPITVAVLAAGAWVYTGLRLAILIYPVATIEDEASLSRCWELGRGQVLSLLAIFLAIAVPVALANLACDALLFGPGLGAALRALFAARPDGHALDALMTGAPMATTLAAAVSLVVLVALQAGASAEAYRALTEENYGYEPPPVLVAPAFAVPAIPDAREEPVAAVVPAPGSAAQTVSSDTPAEMPEHA